MQAQQLVLILESCVNLALILVLVLKLWPSYRLDVFRQQMFAVRDDLFAYAASGKISFDDPAYRLLRQAMNGFLRYGHNLTLYRVLATLILWNIEGRPKTKWSEAWTLSLKGIKDSQVRDDLQQFHVRALDLVAHRLIHGSPILLAGLGLCTIAMLARSQWQDAKQIVTGATEKMLPHIIDPHLLEEEAARLAAA